jgi:uncharacterized protein (TIGR02646 family)
MIELSHRSVAPSALTNFVRNTTNLQASDFDSLAFRPVKQAVKLALHQDQGGLCVYCERLLSAVDGQVEHLLPKAGENAHPHLAFTYTNYAHGCIQNATCGQKKKNGLLPILPAPGCNAQMMLSTDGTILPLPNLTRKQRHPVMQTLQMLGLEAKQSPALKEERKAWIDASLTIMQQAPAEFDAFLATIPFRHILRRLGI